MSTTLNSPGRDMVALINTKHYRARRHSLMHPPSIHLPDRRITVPSPLDAEDTIWKSLLPQTPTSPSPAPPTSSPPSAANTLPCISDTTTTPYDPTITVPPPVASANTATSDLTPTDVHAFCNRDTILYMPYPGPSASATQKLWKAIHRSWTSRRGRDVLGPTGACRPGFWFAKAVVVTGHEGSDRGDDWRTKDAPGAQRGAEKLLVELVGLHECLVKALDRAVGGSEQGLVLQGINPRESPAATEGEQWYGLKTTVGDCFVVVEGDAWESEGVLLVWRGELLAGQLGSGTVMNCGDDNVQGLYTVESKGKWRYKRLRLEEAVLGIMSAEKPQTRKGNVEITGY